MAALLWKVSAARPITMSCRVTSLPRLSYRGFYTLLSTSHSDEHSAPTRMPARTVVQRNVTRCAEQAIPYALRECRETAQRVRQLVNYGTLPLSTNSTL